MTKKNDEAKAIKEGLLKKEKSKPIQKSSMLSTGSTLLNLASTGNIKGGFVKGEYHFFVGDSKSGKTFFCMTCFAELCADKNFEDYRIIYDGVEGGALMDIKKFFGSAVVDRLEAPGYDDGDPVYSETVEEFYFNLIDALAGNRPCIYVEDSMDGLTSMYERAKLDEKKAAVRGGKKAKGDYGDGKAKINSSGLRSILPKLRETGSILIIINQTRDNINAGLFGPKKTRSGGRALTFYAALEMWSSVGKKITKTIKGIPRDIGVNVTIKVKKNRFTGRERSISVPIYYSYGIDDIGGCIEYLIEEGHWKKNRNGSIVATEFDKTLHLHKLANHIEENELETDLKDIVQEVWDEVEKACAVPRKKRYL